MSSGVFAHFGTLGISILRRHLPIWTTSGTLSPMGTFSSVNLPDVSVAVMAMGLPETAASQRSQVFAPSGMSASGAFGTYTVAL